MNEDQKTTQAEMKSQTGQSDTKIPEEILLPDQCEIDGIIRKRVYAAVGLGMVPVPLVDLVGLAAIQLELIHALSKAYGVEFREERAKSLLTSLTGSFLTVATVPLFASIFKAIPLIGTTAGAATVCITGGAATYAVGSVFDKHFREGGTLLDFSAQDVKDSFKDAMEEGKDVAAKLKNKKKGETAGSTAVNPEATI